MAFTTSGQETEWVLFLQPRSPHGAVIAEKTKTILAGSRQDKTHRNWVETR